MKDQKKTKIEKTKTKNKNNAKLKKIDEINFIAGFSHIRYKKIQPIIKFENPIQNNSYIK